MTKKNIIQNIENSQIPTIDTGKKDVFWNYFATLLQIGSGVLMFPVLLKMLSPELIGVWAIFVNIGSLVILLDLGFSTSFTRNITYIISGVNQLIHKGIDRDINSKEVNYPLLSDSIHAMKWFYKRIAFFALILLLSIGTIYFFQAIMSQYQGDDRLNIIISWFLFCIINTYNIYTLYYDALLMGFGYVKLSKQYIIISQLVYLFLTILMIYMDFGILSIVVAQGVSLIVRRILIYRLLSIGNLKQHLTTRKSTQIKEVIQAIYPNAIKLGLTGLGAFLVLNSSVLLGSAFISLPEIGSYSISVQVVNVIASLSMVYFNSYIPKLTQLRVRNDVREIRRLYHRSILILILTYFTGGFLLILAGQPILHLLGSQTNLLSSVMLFTILLISLLEKNHAMAGGVLLLKNEVPFYKAAIISGIATVIVLYVFLHFLDYGIWAMILAPGLVQIAYQNWKWPLKLNKEIKQEIYG